MIIKDKFIKLNKPYVHEIHYNVFISNCKIIHETLGKIKSRKDGRFNWFRKKSSFFKEWNGEGQGVVETLKEAVEIIFKGWTVELENKKDIDNILLQII